MAFDLLSGEQDGRDWSRGDGIRDWGARRALGAAEKKVPWVPIGIGAAAVGVFLLLPSKKTKPAPEYHVRRGSSNTDPTLAIPYQSMKDLVRSRSK